MSKLPIYSSSAFSPSFLAAFFFLFLFLLPVFLERGWARMARISSSSIFLSVLNLERSSAGAAPSLVRPFLVMAMEPVS